ncbi:DegT/DnrJ/EryC1/StrS family aminotransferase [Candidatus Poribacteria bacterium]
MPVPLVDLKAQYEAIRNDINVAIEEVLESQWFILGPKVGELEEQIADYCNVKYSVGVASGSDALLLSLMAVNIGCGDEVITTPFTFFATAGSVSRLGAKPVFVDIDPRTYNIDPQLIEEKITDRTKAIIPVHLYGQCADMYPILEIARKYDLCVIEDAAQAIGAKYRSREAGSMGDLGCLSFFPTKNLGGYGDGGMILTGNEELAEKLKILRAHGSKPKYYHSAVGCNSRLDAIQATILLTKLRYLNKWNESRRQNAEVYNSLFADMDVVTPYSEDFNYHIYNQYVIRVKDRDKLKAFLKEKGIGTEIYYPVPLHLQECYSELGYKPGDMPVSEEASGQTLALPVYPELTREQQEEIVELIGGFLK